MRTAVIAACVLSVLMLGRVNVYAIDGGGQYVDTLRAEASASKDFKSFGAYLEGDTAVAIPAADWAIVAGLGWKRVEPDVGESKDAIGCEIGVKYLVTTLTALSLVGTYEQYDCFGFKDVGAGVLRVEQKFLPPKSGVSPYVKGAFAVRGRDGRLGVAKEDDDSGDMMFQAGAGCEFMLTDSVAIVFDAMWVGVVDSSDTKAAGLASIGLRAYWE